MSVSITEDIKTVSDLKTKTGDVFKQLRRTGRPIIVTVNGKPDAVLINVEVFEKKLKALNLGALIAEAETDVKEKRTRPAREFLREIKRSAKA
ncbi:MAG: type II toxin-antitoxin system Phd/YefM family antitoxin [Candidatus Aenigmarchaeota archaeon]|nr:type II toxin-antitoxin system Phd/YefM family antitoxin [Candidatus Aenigmarchaeota archaeon]